MSRPIAIDQADGPRDLEQVCTLFVEYQQWLGVDFCFQDFEEEISMLPDAYGPPGGRLLLVWDGDAIADGVGLRLLALAR